MRHVIFVADGKVMKAYFWSKDDIVAIEYLNQFNEWVPLNKYEHAQHLKWLLT